jgi:hypothetical protein
VIYIGTATGGQVPLSVSYLDVITAQAPALNNDRTAITTMGNRMNACVLLIKALGGGWESADLPSEKAIGGGILPLFQSGKDF